MRELVLHVGCPETAESAICDLSKNDCNLLIGEFIFTVLYWTDVNRRISPANMRHVGSRLQQINLTSCYVHK